MKKPILCFLITFLLLSCGQDNRKIDNDLRTDTSSAKDNRAGDPAKKLVSELPVKFGGTDVRIFAIRNADPKERDGYSGMGSGSYGNPESASSHFGSDILAGNFVNLLFEDKNGKERKLTDKEIRIKRVTFLREIFNKTKTGYLLYSVGDSASNADKKSDQSDRQSLYISNIDGSGFNKLTKESHHLYDWSTIKGENRIYYRSLEDINKDGKSDGKDRFHYYFADFTGEKYSVTEYNPIKIFASINKSLQQTSKADIK